MSEGKMPGSGQGFGCRCGRKGCVDCQITGELRVSGDTYVVLADPYIQVGAVSAEEACSFGMCVHSFDRLVRCLLAESVFPEVMPDSGGMVTSRAALRCAFLLDAISRASRELANTLQHGLNIMSARNGLEQCEALGLSRDEGGGSDTPRLEPRSPQASLCNLTGSVTIRLALDRLLMALVHVSGAAISTENQMDAAVEMLLEIESGEKEQSARAPGRQAESPGVAPASEPLIAPDIAPDIEREMQQFWKEYETRFQQ